MANWEDLMALEQLLTHQWPSKHSIELFGLSICMNDLAGRLSVKVIEWEEDGCGPARGALVRLTSGRVVLLYELAHAIEHLGSKGASVDVDAAEAAALGFDILASEVRSELSLSNEEIVIMPDDLHGWRCEAARLASLGRQKPHR